MKQVKLLLVLIMLPLFSFAWNGIGHSTGGAIAYYYLKANHPATIAKVVAVLEKHPWYSTAKWQEKLMDLKGEQKNVMLFMLASTFPDDARDVEALGGGEMKQWHYIDYPFVPKGETVTGAEPKSPNAEEKINEFLKGLNSITDPAQKAIDLCWIFHLIEDVHMPLHATEMFDNNNPHGDHGGNNVFITTPGTTEPVRLHSYWDGLVKGTVATAPEHAQELLKNPIYATSKLTELKTGKTVHDWIQKESYDLAVKDVYQGGKVNGTKTNPTTVSAGYDATANKIGERRVVLSGIRLGMKLEGLFP